MKTTNQKGRSMIEMIGVLGIIGLLTVGGFELVSKAYNSKNMNDITNLLTTIAQKSRLYARDLDIAESDNNTDITNKIAGMSSEFEYNNSNSKIEGPDNVNYSIKLLYPSATYKYALFVINVNNLSQEMCLELATINLGDIGTNGFIGRKIGSTDIDWLKENISSQPIGMGTAANSCNTDNISISFAFR